MAVKNLMMNKNNMNHVRKMASKVSKKWRMCKAGRSARVPDCQKLWTKGGIVSLYGSNGSIIKKWLFPEKTLNNVFVLSLVAGWLTNSTPIENINFG